MSFFKSCNAKKIVIIIASIIIILIIIVLIVVLATKKNEEHMPRVINTNVNESTIIYNLNNSTYYIYSIKEKYKNEDKISFFIDEKGKPLDCYECNETILKMEYINNEEDHKKLLDLFDDIFKNTTNNRLYFNNDNLTNEQIGIILSVLENNNFFSELTYELIENNNNYDSTYKKRGYSYSKESDGSVIYTIAMGEKPTGGYFIKVKNVKIKGKDVIIYILEKFPGKDEFLTEALTYPITQIKLSGNPRTIKIVNDNTGEIYSLIN